MFTRYYLYSPKNNCAACPFGVTPCPGPCIGRPFSGGVAGGGKEEAQRQDHEKAQAAVQQQYARLGGQGILAPLADDRVKALEDLRKESAALDQEIARRKRDIDYTKQRKDLLSQITVKRNELAQLNREAGL